MAPTTTKMFMDAVNAAGCQYNQVHAGFADSNLPPLNGNVTAEIKLDRRKETTTTTEWLEHVRSAGRKFAHPLAVLGRSYWKEGNNLTVTVFTVWADLEGRLWYLIFNDGPGRKRDVRVYISDDPDNDQWWSYCQAATVEAN